MKNNWNDITQTPPDELLRVKDENGKTAFAYPTIYPFKVGKSESGQKWTSPVIPSEPYWDGGWMIACEKINISIGRIVGWKTIKQHEKIKV